MKKIYAVVFAFLSLMFVPQSAQALVCTPDIVTHRGVTNTGFTEESLNAVVLGAKMGAEYTDFDVQAAHTGTLYAMHDSTLDRTTNGTGPLGNYSGAQINALRLNDGSRIPTVYSLLNALKTYPVKVSIEIKAPRADTYERLRNLIADFGESRVVVHSFLADDLSAYRAVSPNQTLGLDTPTQVTPATLDSMDADVAIVKQTVTNSTYADILHTAGKELWVWTTNGPSGWNAYSPFADVMVTDQFPAYQDWLAAQPVA